LNYVLIGNRNAHLIILKRERERERMEGLINDEIDTINKLSNEQSLIDRQVAIKEGLNNKIKEKKGTQSRRTRTAYEV
jgi:hypothetical protein